MAKCKICKTNIPEGTEYCNDCLDKKEVKTNESYLDSLLNSVKNTSATAENVYIRNHTKQKRESKVGETTHKYDQVLSEVSGSELSEPNNHTYFSDLEDVKDYDGYDIYDDLDNMKENDNYDLNEDLEDVKDYDGYDINDDLEDNIIISDEDLFGNYFSEEVEGTDFDTKESDINKQMQDRTENQRDIFEQEVIKEENDYVEQDRTEKNEIQEQPALTEAFDRELPIDLDNISLDLGLGQGNSDEKVLQQNENIDTEFLHSLPSQEDYEDYEDEEALDPGLGDLLNSLDISGDISDTEQSVQQTDDTSEASIQKMEEDGIKTDEEDIMSMLNQFSSDDPVAADVQAISDLLNGVNNQPQQDNTMPGDVGEVFSDALKVVSSLDDLAAEERLLQQMSDQESQDTTKKSNKAKDKKIKKKDKAEKKKSKRVKGKGLLGKLFSNVIDENAKKPDKQNNKNDEENDSKATGKVKKAGKKKTGTKEVGDSPDNVGEEKQQNKKEKKAAKKAEKKDKKKDTIQVIEEIEEEEGRINRLGASIVFVFFGILVLLLIIGTNILSYTLSIRHAEKYFERQKYTEAYNEVYGIDIKDEDIALYDKIMTVMFVDKQLNSYYNYYEMKKYPEALDSLLKGLSRYDKYIELATILGISTDLDYVKNQIIGELDDVYHLSEEEARNIMKCNSQLEYSKGVYDVVSENIKY